MLVYYFIPFIVNNRYLLFQVSSGHNSVTVQNRTHVYMNFFWSQRHRKSPPAVMSTSRASPCNPRKRFCFRHITVNSLRKCENRYNNDNNNNNNRPNTGFLISVVLYKIEICWSSFLQLVGVRGQDCRTENIQLILDLPAPGIIKPLKKQNLRRFKPGQTENKTLRFSGTLWICDSA